MDYPAIPSPGLAVAGMLMLLAMLTGMGIAIAALATPRLRDVFWTPGTRTESPRFLPTLAAIALFMLVMVGLKVLVTSRLLEVPDHHSLVYLALTECLLLATVAGALGASRLGLTRALEAVGLTRVRTHHARSALLGWLCAIWVMALVAVAVQLAYRAATGHAPPPMPNEQYLLGQEAAARAAAFLVTVTVIPLTEELFFRGLVFGALRTKIGFWAAAAASSLLFGAVHMSLVAMLPLAVIGFALAWLYERTGSIWPGVMMHALQNSVALGLLVIKTS